MKRSFIDVINIIGVIIVALVVAFAIYTLFVDKPFFEASSYYGDSDSGNEGNFIGSGEESGSYTADKEVSILEVSNISGRINAEQWSGDRIQLDYVKRGPGKHPEVKIDLSGDKLRVAAVYPKIAGNFGSVDFVLRVPENVEYFEARSVSGRIEVTGLGNTMQELSSTSGSVSTDSSGDIEISSVSGALSFSSVGEEISASTTSGSINGRLEKDPASGRIDLSSVSGRIKLEVPSNLNAEVDLHSVSGSVSSEIPVSVTETKRNTIRGIIGTGGTDIEISTVSGAIKISK